MNSVYPQNIEILGRCPVEYILPNGKKLPH